LHLNVFGKRLLPKPTANSIYKLSGKKIGSPLILERKTWLNNNTTANLANKETLIHTNITPDHSNTQPNTVIFRTSTRTKMPPVTKKKDFYPERNLESRGQ
jgi:hypothetical protein